MPAGVPVATVSIGGARNAGLLAARIIGSAGDGLGEAVRERMVAFQSTLRDQAHAKGASLRDEVARGL
jgi:5-(carboxyamino)imidazole ribonucleotide mutase